jgi:hypothetical protein
LKNRIVVHPCKRCTIPGASSRIAARALKRYLRSQ